MNNVKFDRKVVDNAVAAAHVELSGSRVRNDLKGDVRVVKFTKTNATDEQVASIEDSLSRCGNEFAYVVAVVKGNLTVTVSVAPKVEAKKEGKLTLAKQVRALMEGVLLSDPEATVKDMVALVNESSIDLAAHLTHRYVKGNLDRVIKSMA